MKPVPQPQPQAHGGIDVWKILGLLGTFLFLQLRRFQRSQRERCKLMETLPRELRQTCQKRWIYGDETQFLFQSCNCTVWVISPWENWWRIYRSNEWMNDFGQLKTKFCSFASTMGCTHGVWISLNHFKCLNFSGINQITNRDSDQKVTDIRISIFLVWKLKSTDIMYSIKPYL